MADETIVIKYVVEASDAIGQAEKIREAINRSKETIKSLAEQSKMSFADLGAGLAQTFKNLKIEDKQKLADFLKVDPSTLDNVKQFTQARQQAVNIIRTAVRELGQEERAENKASETAIQERYSAEKSLVQESIEWKKLNARTSREMTQEELKTAQQYNQIMRQQGGKQDIFGGMVFPTEKIRQYAESITSLVQNVMRDASRGGDTFKNTLMQQADSVKQIESAFILYGKIVDDTFNKIIQRSKETGKSYAEVAQEMKKVSPEGMGVAIDSAMQKLSLTGKTLTQQLAMEAKATKANQKEIAEAIKERYAEEKKNAQEAAQIVKEIQAQAKAQYKADLEYIKQLKRQEAEAEKAYQKAQAAAPNERYAEEMKFAKEAATLAREMKQQEIQAQREYERMTKQGYERMSAAAQAYGQQVQQIKQQIVTQSQGSGQTYQQVAQQMQQAGTSTNVLNSALKQLNTTGNQTKSTFSSLGSTLKQALVIGLGLNLYNVIQQLINFLGEAAVSGRELAKAFFQLEVGIRAVRRAGVDITTPEMLQNLDRLQEKFGVFSKKSLVEGSSALINLIRDMGMTKEQIFQLQDAIATLAVVNGRSMEDVQRTVALALSSGYTEGLQRLGVSINRVNIAARANAMGWQGGYTALTEHQRAMATLSLIMEKTGKYADDLTEYQKTLAGQFDITTAKIEDQTAALGTKLLPTQLMLSKAQLGLIEQLSDLLTVISPIINGILAMQEAVNNFSKEFEKLRAISPIINSLGNGISFLQKVLDIIFNPFKTLVTAMKGMRDELQKLKDMNWGLTDAQVTRWQVFFNLLSAIFSLSGKTINLPEVPVGEMDLGMDSTEAQGKTLKDYVTDLHNDIEKETRNFNNRMAEIGRDFWRDMEEIDRELSRDLVDLWRDYLRDREKIVADGARKEEDAIADNQKKLVDADRKANQQIEEENIKYREDQIKAEVDFQETLRKLREGFLFDLEDALRERDARQILTLVRRYNLEKTQASRQFEQEQEERARQHQIRLEEIAREREDRKRELAEELADKIAQIRQDTELELAERKLAYEREVEDRNRKAAQDKADRELKRQQQIEELKIDSDNRLKELAIALAQEKDMTAEMLNQIGNEYRRMYGPNGIIEAQIRYHIALLAAAAQAAMRIRNQMMGGASSFSYNENVVGSYQGGTGGAGGGTPYSGMAEGGIIYAERPTTVVFGEKGPEKAEFTPLNRKGMNEGKIVGTDLSSIGSKGGKIELRVNLSPDLVATIQENTLDQAANILFEVQRRS